MAAIVSIARQTWAVGANPLGPFSVTAFRGQDITAQFGVAVWSGTGALATLTFTFDTGETPNFSLSAARVTASAGISRLFVVNTDGTQLGIVLGAGSIQRTNALACGCSVPCPLTASTVTINLQVLQALNASFDVTSP